MSNHRDVKFGVETIYYNGSGFEYFGSEKEMNEFCEESKKDNNVLEITTFRFINGVAYPKVYYSVERD